MGSDSIDTVSRTREQPALPAPPPFSSSSSWLEVGAFVACIGYLLFLLQDILIFGTATLAHDNLFWTLPVFTYFAEGIGNGVLPLWNPYTHGGEPLAHIYLMTRLLDPVSMTVAWVGQFLTSDLILLANWDRLVKALLAALGAYLLLRQWANSLLVRIALVPALVLSNFTANAFWQPGILDQFCYLPFYLIFLLNLLWKRDYRLRNWIGVATFFGASLQSYFFVGPSLLTALLFAGFILFRRGDVWALLRARRNGPKALIAMLMIAAMAGPQAYLYHDLDRFDLPLRERSTINNAHTVNDTFTPPKVGMSYETIHQTGTFSRLRDFVGLLVPGLLFLRRTSEAGMYLGGLVFLGALYGFLFASHPLKRIWVLTGVGVGLLMLGPMAGLHQALYHVFPPLWFLRHTQQLVSSFQLAVLFFFIIGADAWLKHWRQGDSTLASPETPGPLSRWLGDAEQASAIAILAVIGAIFIAGPQLARGYVERPTFPGLVSLTFLAVVAVIYLLRRDLGRWMLAGAIVLGMFGLMSLLTPKLGKPRPVTSPTQMWLYMSTFVLLPVLMVYLWRQDRHERAYNGVRFVSLMLFLFLLMNFLKLSPLPGMPIDQDIARVVLSAIAATTAVGILQPRWLMRVVMPLRTEHSVLRYTAGTMGLVLIMTFLWLNTGGYFELRPAFYFYLLTLTTACLAVALRPRLLADVLSETPDTRDMLRFTTNSLLFCGFLPLAFITAQAITLENAVLRHELAWLGGCYIFVALLRIGVSLSPMMKNGACQNRRGSAWTIRAIGRWIPLGLVLWITLDLSVSLLLIKPQWNMPRPETAYGAPMHATVPTYPYSRVITPVVSPELAKYMHITGQELRYADLFTRTASMLDLLKDPEERLTQESSASLGNRLGKIRHNSFVQFQSYSEMLRSGLPVEILAEIFALDRSLIQFRPCAESKETFLRQTRSMPHEETLSLLRRAVLLDDASQAKFPCQKPGTNGNPFTYEVLKYDYNSIRLKINAPVNGYLYYADGYDPHWTASVDRSQAPLYRANFNFKAVPVNMGEHEVEFAYQPFTLRFLIVVYFMIFLLGLTTTFISFGCSRKWRSALTVFTQHRKHR